VLDSLVNNDLTDWQVIIGQNPTPEAPECLSIVDKYLMGRCEYITYVHKQILDVRQHPFKMISKAFNHHDTDLMVYVEDDTPVGNDILDLADAWNGLSQSKKGMCLCYQNYDVVQGPVDVINKVHGYQANLAFATNQTAWDTYFAPYWFRDDHNLHGKGYDWSLAAFSKTLYNGYTGETGIHTWQCAHTRVTNIGKEGGAHAVPEAFAVFDKMIPAVVEKPVEYKFVE
jgi:hypothetical protein